jgi:hypothetical protein
MQRLSRLLFMVLGFFLVGLRFTRRMTKIQRGPKLSRARSARLAAPSDSDLQLVRRGALQNQRMRTLSSYSYSLHSALCTLNLVIHQDLLVISRAACSAFFAIIRRADLSKPLFTR